MAEEKRADSSTQLEVDEAILDYLLFTATQALLEDFKALKDGTLVALAQGAADIPLQLVDCESDPSSLND